MKVKGGDKGPDKVKMKTKTENAFTPDLNQFKWWEANSKKDLAAQLINTAAFLKEQQQYRYRHAGLYARLYGNMPLFGVAGSNLTLQGNPHTLPMDRPTMNVIQSCVDTLHSRVTQSKPRPVFLTDNGDYNQRKLAKELNNFILGEFYQTKTYPKTSVAFKDSEVFGTGCLKVYEDVNEKRVALERILQTELLVDPNDAYFAQPRQLMQFKLIDRDVAMELYPDKRSFIAKSMKSFPEANDIARTVSDQIMIVEGWHLPSGKNASDGLHTIACSEGVLFEESYKKDKFPFAFFHYSPRLLGFWGQPLTEQLMGTQIEINRLLITISRSINLVGVPRIFMEMGSDVAPADFNDEIGAIIKYRGIKPEFEVAPCIPQEVYAQLQRLVDYAYQQSGISQLNASAQKPAGLNSGTALREYDDLQTDRFASMVRRYDDFHIDLAYLMVDLAKDIAERDGKYETVYPGKDGTRQIDLPASDLLKDPFVIQCYDSSSLPRDPAARKEYVIEMMQAGVFSTKEGRRLLSFPDLEQEDKLANAAEERILQILDDIVEHGKYTPPDPFMDLQLALTLVVQYYNLYTAAKLTETRADLLRQFQQQLQDLISEASQPPPMPAGAAPLAQPQAPPTSPMLPNAPG